jgi:hypothetical protein
MWHFIFYHPPSKKMSDCSICYDAVIDYPAPEGSEATGSHRSSCRHLFHPKCISKWHLQQKESTCPMCRKVAVNMEDCSPRRPPLLFDLDGEPVGELPPWWLEAAGEYEPYWRSPGIILLFPFQIDDLLLQAGGVGMIPSQLSQLYYEEYGNVVTTRDEIDRIFREQGCNPLSDAQWTQLYS